MITEHYSFDNTPDEVDERMELWVSHSEPDEDINSFCDRMANKYGQNWIYILNKI